jgi:hypothetical protein
MDDLKRAVVSAAALLLMLLFSFSLAGRADAMGSAPNAENLELTTRRDTPVTGVLSGKDPENGQLSYRITTQPIKGSITLHADGSFQYCPFQGKKGRDYFGYRAVDSEGNQSEEATVLIRIEKE